jgi:hypothetical protein
MGTFKMRTKDGQLGLSVKELLRLYYRSNAENNADKQMNDGAKVEKAMGVLDSYAPLLWDYFGIEIATTEAHGLTFLSVPCLIEGYLPQLTSLPSLVYHLSIVDYENEGNCFEEISRALANYFTPQPFPSKAVEQRIGSSLQRLVFPCLKTKFLPPSSLTDSLQLLTSTEEAFKKFGRC